MNRDEITRKTSELSTPDTPTISLLKTVIQRKKKWHFSRAILPFRLAKRKSLSNAWEKSAGSPAERPLRIIRREKTARPPGREALATAEKKLYPYTQITHNKTAQVHMYTPNHAAERRQGCDTGHRKRCTA